MIVRIGFPRRRADRVVYEYYEYDIDISDCKDVDCIVEKIAYAIAEEWCSSKENCDVDKVAYSHTSWIYYQILPLLEQIAMDEVKRKGGKR